MAFFVARRPLEYLGISPDYCSFAGIGCIVLLIPLYLILIRPRKDPS